MATMWAQDCYNAFWRAFVDFFFSLATKKSKASALKDRKVFSGAEVEGLEQIWAAGSIRDIYQQTNRYAGKRRPVGTLYLTTPSGGPLE